MGLKQFFKDRKERKFFWKWINSLIIFGGPPVLDFVYKGYLRYRDYPLDELARQCGLTPEEAERVPEMIRLLVEYYSDPDDYMREVWAEDLARVVRKFQKPDAKKR